MTKSIAHLLKEFSDQRKPTYALTVNSLGMLSYVLNAAHDIEIYKYLKDKDLTIEELANVTKTNLKILSKILRILSHFGFIEQVDGKTYKANDTTEQLNFLDPSFLGNKAERALCNLFESLKTGNLSWNITYKKSFYETLSENPDFAKAFYEWHLETAKLWLYPLISRYNFAQFNTLIDLGGGQGCFIKEVLQNNKKMHGILFERTEVVKDAETFLNISNVQERCTIIGGSLFQSVPEGGDAYCLNRVLLNMNDDQALQILNNCRLAMKPHAKLLIIDVIAHNSIDSSAYPFFLLNDLRLYLLMGGCHRDKTEWEKLLKKASFSISKISSFEEISLLSIIEANPI